MSNFLDGLRRLRSHSVSWMFSKMLHVGFLLDQPTKALVAALDPHRSPPDEFVVRGRDVYLHLPNGGGNSKLTSQWFDSILQTTITVRNWITVMKLLELAAQ